MKVSHEASSPSFDRGTNTESPLHERVYYSSLRSRLSACFRTTIAACWMHNLCSPGSCVFFSRHKTAMSLTGASLSRGSSIFELHRSQRRAIARGRQTDTGHPVLFPSSEQVIRTKSSDNKVVGFRFLKDCVVPYHSSCMAILSKWMFVRKHLCVYVAIRRLGSRDAPSAFFHVLPADFGGKRLMLRGGESSDTCRHQARDEKLHGQLTAVLDFRVAVLF